jgi:hypothetical protein
MNEYECIHNNKEIKENFNCFWDDLDPVQKCKKNSTSDSGSCYNVNYELEGFNCVLKSCTKRTPNASVLNFPCGLDPNCLLDDDGSKCVEKCSDNELYEVMDGKCEMKRCNKRISNGSSEKPCGLGCFNVLEYSNDDKNVLLSNSCANGCPSRYADKSSNGICLYVFCEESIVKGNEEVCGYECLYDRNDNSCHENCSNTDHYEIFHKICQLKLCDERISNDSDVNPCGMGCFLNKSAADDETLTKKKCLYVCDENYKSENGICVKEERQEILKKSSGSTIYVIIFIILVVIAIALIIFNITLLIYKEKKRREKILNSKNEANKNLNFEEDKTKFIFIFIFIFLL